METDFIVTDIKRVIMVGKDEYPEPRQARRKCGKPRTIRRPRRKCGRARSGNENPNRKRGND